jgi:heme-degrading monooxygenase HmoA
MIVRLWRALAHRNEALNYVGHLRAETFPALKKIPGFIDASILSRAHSAGVEFLIETRWESLTAISSFAGVDAEAAVVPPKVVRMMIEYDGRARHFEVIQFE